MNGEVDPSAWRQAAERLKQAMRIGCAGAVLAVAGVACVDAPDAPPPPCIEATPSPELGKLKETVNTAMETTLDYWEHYEGIEATLDVKPPQFFEEGDEKCTTPDDIVIGGPAYALASNQMYLRSTKDIDLNDPVVAVAATAHEMGHALQEKEEQPYHPESKEDKLAYSIVHEVREYASLSSLEIGRAHV